MVMIPFAAWRPDLAELNGSYTEDVTNVLLGSNSYLPFPSPVPFADALAEAPLGYWVHRTLSGTIEIFVGTASKLMRLDPSTRAFVDVSKAGGYNATPEARWEARSFGERVIFVNNNDDPQYFDVGSSTLFADLPGSPPRAGKINVWGSFVVLSDLTSNPNRNHWSGLENSGQWTPGVNNSDYQDHPDGGRVVGSTDATNPLIIQERAIRAAYFVPGSVEVFSFKKVQDGRGAKASRSIASRGDFAFYADDGGFFQLFPDGSVAPIGFEKVDRTLFTRMAFTDIQEIVAAIDPFYARVYFSLSLSGDGQDTVVVYDWELKEWSKAAIGTMGIFPAATIGYTLDSLGDVYPNLDELPYSLDSKVWQGGAPLLATFDTSFRLCFCNGPALEATLTTQEMGDPSGQVSLITALSPVIDTTEITLSIGGRFRRTDPVVWTPEFAVSGNTGIGRKRNRARFQKARARVVAGATWRHAQGVEVASQPAGMR